MEQFDITLKNEKEGTYLLMILLLVILHVLFFIFLIFNEQYQKTGGPGLTMLALYSVYRFIISKRTGRRFFYPSDVFFLFMIVLSSFSYWLMIPEGILYFFAFSVLHKRSVSLNSYFIEIKIFPATKYKWSNFSNIVLKDNILTLDLNNNKLIQGEIETTVNEVVFNAFVKDHLPNQPDI